MILLNILKKRIFAVAHSFQNTAKELYLLQRLIWLIQTVIFQCPANEFYVQQMAFITSTNDF